MNVVTQKRSKKKKLGGKEYICILCGEKFEVFGCGCKAKCTNCGATGSSVHKDTAGQVYF